MQQRQNFIYKNEPFTCENCGHQNPLPKQGIRNHCQQCLYSKHLDCKIPGDRASNCHGLMTPISATQSGKKGWLIRHLCQKCQKEIPNMANDDDNWDAIIELSRKPWIN